MKNTNNSDSHISDHYQANFCYSYSISLGGDSDTLAAITGSIAEAAYGIPGWMKERAWSYLDEPIRDVCRRWREYMKEAQQ